MIKLHVAPPSPRAFKVLAVARHLGLDFELCPVDLLNGAHLRPEFAALNPNRRMPVLEDDGFVLWESNAITQYLASKKPERGLLPTDPRKCADVSRWQFWESCHWDPACATLIFERMLKKVLGQGDPTPAHVEKGEADVRQLGASSTGCSRDAPICAASSSPSPTSRSVHGSTTPSARAIRSTASTRSGAGMPG